MRELRTGIDVFPRFSLNVLPDHELDSIHYATLQVLKRVGLKVESDEAIEIFHGAGASIDRRENSTVVKLPPYVIEDCIRYAPSTFVYYGRKPENDFVVQPNRTGFSTFGECIKIIDPYTREVRKSVKKDVGQVTLVCDSLPEINIMVRPLCSSDHHPATQPLHNLEAVLQNTTKHVLIGAGNARNVPKMVEMAATSVGGFDTFKERPNLTFFVCPTSPLMLGRDCCEIIVQAARSGVGIAVIPMALAGATSTATLAGTLVTHNAEVLGAIVLAQLTAKGTPCTYCSMSTIMDLKLMAGPVGAPEHGMLSAALTKMARYYRLPSWVGGGVSDSKIPDAQVGYEFAMNCLLGALSGANVVYGAGALELGLTIDYATLLMDAEMIRWTRQIMNGIEVTDETLALDVIYSVGAGGEFLTSNHTLHHMKRQSQPKLFDRRTRLAWQENGGKNLTERAYEQAHIILENYKPQPLPDRAVTGIRQIIEEYEQELGLSQSTPR